MAYEISSNLLQKAEKENQGRGTRDEGRGKRDEGRGTRDEGPGTGDRGPGTRDPGPETTLIWNGINLVSIEFNRKR